MHLQDGNNLLEVGKSSGCLASKKGGNCKYMSLKKKNRGIGVKTSQGCFMKVRLKILTMGKVCHGVKRDSDTPIGINS